MSTVRRGQAIDLLGVSVQALTAEDLNQSIARSIADGARIVVANHNLHSIYLYHHEPRMRRFFAEAEVIHIDSMALIPLARLLGHAVRREHRVTYLDWIDPLLSMARQQRQRIFFLGSTAEVVERGKELLRRRYPGLEVEAEHGYFDAARESEENRRRLRQIAEFRTHILVVGMGMPRQEIWTLENRERIEANAVLMAGGCLDYLTGAVPTPPRWLGQIGLEWLFRLVSQPRRLAGRYLWEPWFLLPHLARDLRRRLRGPRQTSGC